MDQLRRTPFLPLLTGYRENRLAIGLLVFIEWGAH